MKKYKNKIEEGMSREQKYIERVIQKLYNDLQVEFELDVYGVIMADAILRKGYKMDELIKRAKEEIQHNEDLY